MEIVKLKGIIDRVTAGVAAIVPDGGGMEKYVAASDIPGAHEGMPVNLLIIPADDLNGLSKVVGRMEKKKKKVSRFISFSSLVNAMEKNLEKLRNLYDSAEFADQASPELRSDVAEKISYLEKGIRLFNKRF